MIKSIKPQYIGKYDHNSPKKKKKIIVYYIAREIIENWVTRQNKKVSNKMNKSPTEKKLGTWKDLKIKMIKTRVNMERSKENNVERA